MAEQTIVLLDVMDTIVHDPFFVEVPQFFGLHLEQLLAQKHPSSWFDFEEGRSDEERYLKDFFADGRSFDHDGLRRVLQEAYSILDGVEDILSELKSRGISMHALSNYPVWYRWIEDKLKLSRFLEWTFVSCLTGLRKPALKTYENVVHSLNVPASRCLFVDDREQNCEAAEQVGMSSIVFRNAAQLRRELQERRLL